MRLAIGLVVTALWAGMACAQDLVLWDGVASEGTRVVGVGTQGVRVVEDGADVGELVPWHLVRAVRGRHADAAEVYQDVARAVWRGVTRLERGDYAGAVRAIEPVAPAYAGEAGPTSEVIAGVLLEAAMERGEHGAAVAAWSAWRRATDGGGRSFRPVIDRVDTSSGLVTELFPLWQVSVPTQGGQRDDFAAMYALAGEAGQGGPATRIAARVDALWAESPQRVDVSGDGLLLACVAATSGSQAIRARARGILEGLVAPREAATTPEWIRAWALLAIGRSLAIEDDGVDRQRGVMYLLAVAAESSRSQPLLAGHALAEAARVLEADGRTREAVMIDRELGVRFAGHPAQRRRQAGTDDPAGRSG